MANIKTIQISEGSIKLKIPDPKKYKLDAKSPAFYNPAMISNRDISILLLKVFFGNKSFHALDLLSATGVRAIRLKKEIPNVNVWANDAKESAFALIKENAKLNKLKIKITNEFANKLLADSPKFDYIDLDPFGTPVPFLDAVMQKLNLKGILAVTATDTTVLCGAEYKACVRRYKAKPLHNYLMHEVGVRILAKYVIETGLKHKLYLKPVFSQSTRHYMRIYFKAVKDKLIKRDIKVWKSAGPMWLGSLWDVELVKKMLNQSRSLSPKTISRETVNLLYKISEEARIPIVGFFDLSEMKLKQVPKLFDVISKLQEKGYFAARTHFSPTGIKTNAKEKEFKNILRSLG